MTEHRQRTLADEVAESFRIVTAGAVAIAVVLLAMSSWFLFYGAPREARAAKALAVSNNLHAAMLNEISSVRAYLVTDQPLLLVNLRSEQDAVDHYVVELGRDPIPIPNSDARALATSIDAWQGGWVAHSVDPTTRKSLLNRNGIIDSAALQVLIASGRASYDSAQTAQRKVLNDASHAQSAAHRNEVIAISSACLVLVALAGGVGTATIRRRRRLQERIVGPIAQLLDKVRAVGQGEDMQSPAFDAPSELMDLREELVDMSGSLRLQQQALATRAEQAAASARRLKLVVDFAREVSDSLTLAHCLGVVTVAVRKFCEAPRARVWLLDEHGQSVTLRHDSITGAAVPEMTRSLGYGGLGRAAQAHRISLCDGLAGEVDPSGSRAKAIAVPMLKGRRLIGVLEILMHPGRDEPPAETLEVIEAMAAQAATAIDAALVHALTESLSLSDPLTGLGNRRQLDQDLALEVERAARYGRSLAVLMIDIDHFKQVNDTFGHGVGDAVLSEVARLLAEHARGGDTVYRYGGEEFAVLARESDISGAAIVAERLRAVVESHYASSAPGDVAVTVSIGVASVSDTVDAAQRVLEASDAALYDAKRGGRNRVEIRNCDIEIPSQRTLHPHVAAS